MFNSPLFSGTLSTLKSRSGQHHFGRFHHQEQSDRLALIQLIIIICKKKAQHFKFFLDKDPTPTPSTMSGDEETSKNGSSGTHASEEKDDRLSGTKRSLGLPDKPISELTADELASADLQEFELDPDKRKEVRKMRRVMANRRSARESRERRKKLLTDLQESVENLTSENANLSKENTALRQELASLIEQSGGASSLGMLPNIQSLL